MSQPPDDTLRCHRLLDVARLLGRCTNLDELLSAVVAGAMELLSAERASVFLYDGQSRELISRVAEGEQEIRFSIDAGVAGFCARRLETVCVGDAYADERFNPEIDRQTGFRTRNILSIPALDYEGKLAGVLQVLNKRGGAFTDDDLAVGEALAAQAGVALQRAMLMEHYLQKQYMERSLEIARQIQQSQWPREAPSLPGWDLAGWSRPADQTGGDTYDFIPSQDGGSVNLLLADATGHGIGPALVVAQARAMIRALGRGPAEVSAVMQTVNALLADDLEGGRFVTCFLGRCSPNGVDFVSAGQGPLLIYRPAGDSFEALSATEPPLGVIPGLEFGQLSHIDLAPGDLLVVTTDGYFEAFNPADEQFGQERMEQVIRNAADQTAREIIDRLTHAVDDFRGRRAQADDLTALVLKKL